MVPIDVGRVYCFWVSDRWHELSFLLVLDLGPQNICRFPQKDSHG